MTKMQRIVTAGLIIICIGAKAQSTSVPLKVADWQYFPFPYGGNENIESPASSGYFEETAEGLKFYDYGSRGGARILSRDNFRFADTTLYVKWKINGNGNWGFFMIDIPNITSDAQKFTWLSATYSYAGTVVVGDNRWYYTRVAVNPSLGFTSVTASGNYDDQGGSTIQTKTGTLSNNISNIGQIRIGFLDTYASSVSTVVGEVKIGSPGIRAPIITSQPTNNTVNVGASVTLAVTAVGATPLTYQWRLNSQNITGATNSSLTVTNVRASDSGGYSVCVTNSAGSAMSASASLAVLTDGANGNQLAQIAPVTTPTKTPDLSRLVVVTHGYAPLGVFQNESWVYNMCAAISNRVPNTCIVMPYIWKEVAGGTPSLALTFAQIHGKLFGASVAQGNWQSVHLIGHSSGAGFVEAVADKIKQISPSTIVHCTFLDPYTGAFHEWQNQYGANADWSECYTAVDWTGGGTAGRLANAFNADVSWLDPKHTVAFYGFSGQDVALSSHGWPVDFYMQSITNTDPTWCGADYGYALSAEDGGWGNHGTLPIGHTPLVVCGPQTAVQNPNPGVAGLTEIGLAIGSTAISAGSYLLDMAFKLVTYGTPTVESVRGMNGVLVRATETNAGTPAWFAVGVTVTSKVNFVSFQSGFDSTNPAQGLLTVYWNTNQIGVADERIASAAIQTNIFFLPSTVTDGVYSLSFRLDSFNGTNSSILITNLYLGYSGPTNQLSVEIQSGLVETSRTFNVHGDTGFNYLVQASTNLSDWVTFALLPNTNGVVQFTDPSASNINQRFYRAVLP